MQFKILSYHLPDNPREALDLQREVFARCGLAIEQRCLPLPWPASLDAVDAWVREMVEFDTDCGIILCDSDVIPLHRRAVQDVYFPAIEAGTLIGFANYANHLPGTFVCAAVSMLGFSAELFDWLGRPSVRENETVDPRYDVGGKFTLAARERDIPVQLLPPTSYDPPAKWKLYSEKLEWGLNCTFAGLFFHALEFRFHPERFIAKAKEVLQTL
jgi:hypothetical protein